MNVYFHSLYRLCAHLKCSLVDMLYRKSLRISCGARSELGAGVVNNLQSNDAAKLCVPTRVVLVGFGACLGSGDVWWAVGVCLVQPAFLPCRGAGSGLGMGVGAGVLHPRTGFERLMY